MQAPARVVPDAPSRGDNDHDQPQHAKPYRLPEVRQHGEGQARSVLVPYAVVIASNDVKSILSWRDVAIVHLTFCAGIDPFGIQTINTIFELVFVRSGKTQCGVLKLKLVPPRWYLQRGVCRPFLGDYFAIHEKFLNNHWWGKR